LAALARWLAGVQLRQLHFNGCVSYPQPLALVQRLMQALDAQPQAALVVHLHDYHVVCPSPFLLDADQRYCGVPQDLQRCRDCLGRQRDAQVGLAAGVSIDDWRARFGAVLRRAAEVRCFSRSSIELLRRAYPDLDAPTLQLRPHAVAAFGAPWAPPAPGTPPTLAVVGHIGLHKGAQVVAELARALERRGAHDRLRLIVVGTIDGPLPPAVRVTGAFERDDLPRLLSDEGVGFALLPSICPETFSFVVHELLALGLPLAAFDLGAQAEALRAQGGRALLLDPSAGADAWLDQLLDFAARAVASQPAAAHPTPSHA
jgi:glycosyltransferase involved in cell wall biosynthesis